MIKRQLRQNAVQSTGARWNSARSKFSRCATLLALLAAMSGDSSAWSQTARRTFRAYSVPGESLSEAADALRDALDEEHLDGEVVVDKRRQRVLLGGDTAAHELAAEMFPQAKEPQDQPQDAEEETVAASGDSDEMSSHGSVERIGVTDRPHASRVVRASTTSHASAQLKHLDCRKLLSVVQGVYTERLSLQQSDDGNHFVTTLPGKHGDATLRMDLQSNELQLDGDQEVINAWIHAIQTLDSQATNDDLRMMALGKVQPQSISRIIELLQTVRDRATVKNARWGADVVGIDPPPPRTIKAMSAPTIALAQADDAGPPDDGDDVQNAGEDSDETVTQVAPLGEGALGLDGTLLGSVQIEFVEGLDAIIIRGRKPDVDRVMQLINRLEALTQDTQPAIELIVLEHVNSQSMSDLATQLNVQALQLRLGSISITPLIKPNALLLIGRPDGVTQMIELIKRLDQPVEPTSQFQIFRLQHLPATEAAQTVTNFFSNRTGLGPRIQAQADFRTNSLIVYASPRDMAEVQALLAKIDATENAATSQVKVFKLRNALAEELAPVLQSTLRGESQAGGGGGGGQQGQVGNVPGLPNAAPAGTTGNTSGGRTGRSAVLEMIRIDAQGKQVLRSGILTEVTVSADVRANSLIVTAPAESMDLIENLVKQLDALPTSESEIKVFTMVKGGDAVMLTQMLQELFGQTQQNQNANQPFGGAFGIGAGESNLIPLRFSVDPRSNSIIATGSAADLDVVHAILLRLDAEDATRRTNRVYRLQNAYAVAVADAINESLLQQRQITLQLAPETVSTSEQIEREVVVVPETVSNSLIISATPKYYDEIERIIRELDERPPMVLIQVLIAEVSLDNLDEFGVELGLQDSLLFDRSVVANNVVAPGFNFNNQPLGNGSSAASLATREKTAGQGLTNFNVGRTNGDLGFGGLVLSASSESVNVLIRALQQSQRLDVLSRPQVQTLNNQPAQILVGQLVPRIESSQLTQIGTINNTVLQEVGLVLGVTPRISPDGTVVMEIDAVKSELGPTDEGIPISINQNGDVIRSPIINTTEARTTISARSGQTVILGGLITKSRSSVTRRVPYLSDIPLLGQLFRFDSVSDERTELLIIMTPHIIRKAEDADWLNMVESERMSWCLADVVDVNGDIGFASGGSDQTMVIHPDQNATGESIVPGTEEEPQPAYDPSSSPSDLQQGPLDSSEPVAPEPMSSRGGLFGKKKSKAESASSEIAPVQYLEESPRKSLLSNRLLKKRSTKEK